VGVGATEIHADSTASHRLPPQVDPARVSANTRRIVSSLIVSKQLRDYVT